MKKTFAILGLLAIFLLFAVVFRLNLNKLYIEKDSFVVYENAGTSGMFAMFSGILGALDYYDQGQLKGIRVDLNDGPYLDSAHGPNWWNYFFSPVDLGDSSGKIHAITIEDHLHLAHKGFHMSRHRASELIQKYVHVSPGIQEEVDAFVRAHFDNHFVIGVHHRGTDKVTEMPLIPYERTINTLNEVIANLKPEQKVNFKIYVASDDQHFLTYLTQLYPEKLIYGDFVRSEDETPLHLGNDARYGSVYQKGKEALLECLLLARCQYLIRPWSSLSIVSDHFNPDIPVASLMERHWFKALFKPDTVPKPLQVTVELSEKVKWIQKNGWRDNGEIE